MQVIVGGQSTDSLRAFVEMLKVGYTHRNPNIAVEDIQVENGLNNKI